MSDSELCLQEIGKRIMDRRKKLGLTQEALAEKGDVTTQFVSYAESGKRAMRPENLLKILLCFRSKCRLFAHLVKLLIRIC